MKRITPVVAMVMWWRQEGEKEKEKEEGEGEESDQYDRDFGPERDREPDLKIDHGYT